MLQNVTFLSQLMGVTMKQPLQDRYWEPNVHLLWSTFCTIILRGKAKRVGMPCGEVSFTTSSVPMHSYSSGFRKQKQALLLQLFRELHL